MSNNFIDLLNATHQFPCSYRFKVVIPQAKSEELEQKFIGFKLSRRESKGGKYVSYNIEAKAINAEQVLSFYDRAKEVEGAILL